MIDLHCHLLPGIDDGPETLDEALAMARMAVSEGIVSAWVTPHLHVGRWENDLASVTEAVDAYRAALVTADIPLKIGFAAEVRLDYAVVPMIEAGRVPFYGEMDGYKVILLEFPHSHVPVGAAKFVDWLISRRIRPMVAHPERNKDIMREPKRLEPFVAAGCLVQLTADAVAGEFGDLSALRAIEFLERGWVSVLATDAHDTQARPPRMAAGRDVAAGIVGEAGAQRLVHDIPLSIVGGA